MPLTKDSRVLRVFKGIMFQRLFLGFYCEDLIKCKPIQIFLKVCFVVMAPAFCIVFYVEALAIEPFFKIAFIAEYIIAVISSFYINACPLSYLSSVVNHCEASKTETMVLVAVWGVTIYTYLAAAVYMLRALTFCINYTFVCESEPLGLVTSAVLGSCVEIAKIPKSISCVLLLCDIKSLQVMIKIFGFKVDGNNSVDYMQVYKDIYKGFQKIENKIKCLIFLDMIFFIPSLASNVSLFIADMKSGEEWNLVRYSNMLSTILNLVLNLFPMLVFEAVAEIQEKIIGYVLDRRLASSDEGVRKSARKLATYMTERPLRYTLWYTVPLDMTFVIGTISIYATYIVAVLQMSLDF